MCVRIQYADICMCMYVCRYACVYILDNLCGTNLSIQKGPAIYNEKSVMMLSVQVYSNK